MQKITPVCGSIAKPKRRRSFMCRFSRILRSDTSTRYGEAGAEVSGRPKGSVMTVTFEIEGQEFMALNGGPHFTFTEAISLMVKCETQRRNRRDVGEALPRRRRRTVWLVEG